MCAHIRAAMLATMRVLVRATVDAGSTCCLSPIERLMILSVVHMPATETSGPIKGVSLTNSSVIWLFCHYFRRVGPIEMTSEFGIFLSLRVVVKDYSCELTVIQNVL